MAIELTTLELIVLKEQLENEKQGIMIDLDPSTEKGRAFSNVLNKALKLMSKLNAYDELEDSLLRWFLNKYEAQQ